MIHAHLSAEERGRLQVQILGHAGFAAPGEDVVCAAVSALTFTLLGGAEQVLEATVSGCLEPGVCDVEVVVDENRGGELRLLAEVFRYGLRRLVETYPNRVKLIKGRENHGA